MGNKKDVAFKLVNIKKVILSSIAPYLSDFKDIDVNISISIKEEYAENNKVSLDYKLFNLAICNFIDNAIKYTAPGETITFEFQKQSNTFKIEVTMLSLRIDKEELDRIFDEGYSGKHASSEAGNGIGMSVIKKALELMDMRLVVRPNYSKSDKIQGRQYVENTFIIESLAD